MQDLSAVAKNLQSIAAAFQSGGLYFLLGVIAFLGYKVALALAKRKSKDTQEVTVNVSGAAAGPDTSAGGMIPTHSPGLIREHEGRIARAEGGIENLKDSLETFHQENRQDHQRIFTALKI